MRFFNLGVFNDIAGGALQMGIFCDGLLDLSVFVVLNSLLYILRNHRHFPINCQKVKLVRHGEGQVSFSVFIGYELF